MNHKRTTISIVLATLMLVSLFAVLCSATSVSGQTMAGTGPAVSSSNTGQWYIFAVDTGGALWYTPSGSSSTWTSLGGVCTASPAAVSWNTYPNSVRLDVFVRGTDGACGISTIRTAGPAGNPSVGSSQQAPALRSLHGQQGG